MHVFAEPYRVPIVEGRGVMVACESTRKNFVPLQMSAYQLWPAVHTLNYILVPPKGRILFVSCANLIWSVFEHHSIALSLCIL